MRSRVLVALACLPAFGDTQREEELERRLQALEQRLAALEARPGTRATCSAPAQETAAAPQPEPAGKAEAGGVTLPGGVTVSGYFDGNYTFNFNQPYNRVNLLRAYDTQHNNFSINQTGLVLERAV